MREAKGADDVGDVEDVVENHQGGRQGVELDQLLLLVGWTITADQLAALSPDLRAHISRFGAAATDELTHQPDPFGPTLTEGDFTTVDLAA
ncbi:hypothetical protein [Nocardia australiensis]|uniref:hypothetical protein n=1 Tax=Nocardia australiensis TaxID=2887191 RepID=UPI001D14AAB1|nr:hypothetical protein [Nocardia australiensis]